MNELKWNYDETTAYWANRVTFPLLPNTQKQFEGSPLVENSWKKHIINNSFPEYCHHPYKPGHLLCSPSNIIKCFKNDKVLEALVLTIVWGGMTRTKGKIYTQPNKTIEEILLKCMKLTKAKNSVMDSWNLLVNELKWSAVITSKCLHFLVRSLGYEINPPVPIDNAVIIKKVWPKFKEMIRCQRRTGEPIMCEIWWSDNASWDAYNRYMTAISCWSKPKGWTTTQIENTIFEMYH